MRMMKQSVMVALILAAGCATGLFAGFSNEDCPAEACSMHGDCLVIDAGPTCECHDGYDGESCQRCDAGFYRSGGVCVVDDRCAAVSCLNGGSCVGGNCDCAEGFTGPTCDDAATEAALDCDGDDAVVIDVAGQLTSPSQLTIEYWFRINPRDDAVDERREVLLGAAGIETFAHFETSIFFIPDLEACSLVLSIATSADGGTEFGSTQLSRATACETSVWHHYAATFDTTTGFVVEIFLDGTRVATESWAEPEVGHLDADVLYLCGTSWAGLGGDFLRGTIDDVRVSSTIRYSADFVPASSLSVDADDIVLLDFDEGIYDLSSPSNALTTEGAPNTGMY